MEKLSPRPIESLTKALALAKEKANGPGKEIAEAKEIILALGHDKTEAKPPPKPSEIQLRSPDIAEAKAPEKHPGR